MELDQDILDTLNNSILTKTTKCTPYDNIHTHTSSRLFSSSNTSSSFIKVEYDLQDLQKKKDK